MIEETGLTPVQLWVAPTINSFYEPKGAYICQLAFCAAKDEEEINNQLSYEHIELICS